MVMPPPTFFKSIDSKSPFCQRKKLYKLRYFPDFSYPGVARGLGTCATARAGYEDSNGAILIKIGGILSIVFVI